MNNFQKKANCLEIDALNIPVEKVKVELEHPQFGILKNCKSHVRAYAHLDLKKGTYTIAKAVCCHKKKN